MMTIGEEGNLTEPICDTVMHRKRASGRVDNPSSGGEFWLNEGVAGGRDEVLAESSSVILMTIGSM